MKKKVYAFLIAALVITCITPGINLAERIQQRNFKNLGWKKLSTLYTIDWVMPYLGRATFGFGISINPTKAFLGKDGWIYLGDSDYTGNPQIAKRQGANPERVYNMARVIIWMNTWKQWLSENGVDEFRFMIGPDKESIYPEHLPDWMQQAPVQVSDLIPHVLPSNLYIDLYAPLRREKAELAKRNPPLTVYYATDTHWNFMGAWTAMSELGKSLQASRPDLKWFSPDMGDIVEVKQKGAGDMTQFLHINDRMHEQEIVLRFMKQELPHSDYFDYATNEQLPPNHINITDFPRALTLIKTPDAMNKKKLLWLHDSFGIWMYPLMRSTFSEILHIHPQFIDDYKLEELVKTYKPDYVIVTNVERLVLTKEFYGVPPAYEPADSKN
ncbi:hypothetical protein WJT86_10695 [Microvirga sp. W0021]|uniref:AlgX/AlgJ SGNH hydrolase-like domain-containing protein n=1 Tax=Hohaiivirga grylli TaxID=3133970 RepID=A0ABV0BKR4_9HYPH